MISKIFSPFFIYIIKKIRRKYNPYTIAITGSAGKTTIKLAISSYLRQFYPDNEIRTDKKSFNTISGITFTILKVNLSSRTKYFEWFYLIPWLLIKLIIQLLIIRKYPKILILELAGNDSYINQISQALEPNIGIITNIGAAHLEGMISVDKVFEAKSNVVKYTKSSGLVILKKSDAYTPRLMKISKAQVKLIAGSPESFLLETIKAVSEKMALPIPDALEDITNLISPEKRSEIIKIRDVTVIDSTYNANPISMKFEFERLGKIAKKRKIMVLGDMLELGQDSKQYHEKTIQEAKKYADHIIGVGDQMAGCNVDFSTNDLDQAYQHLFNMLAPGDTILLKGSNKVNLKYIVHKLKE